MSFDLINGYRPRTYDEIHQQFTDSVNKRFDQNYSAESIKGTNFDKFGYTFKQMVMYVENIIVELEVKLLDFIRTVNEKIAKPKSSPSGMITAIEEEFGLQASFKTNASEEDAGFVSLAIDVDADQADYAKLKRRLLDYIGEFGDGAAYYTGTERGTFVHKNGQAFEYAYHIPTVRKLDIKIQVTTSANTNNGVFTIQQVKKIFEDNFAKMYRLGFNFEPDTYLTTSRDLLFASEIKIAWKEQGAGSPEYSTAVLNADYNQKLVLGTIQVEVN